MRGEKTEMEDILCISSLLVAVSWLLWQATVVKITGNLKFDND